MSNNMISSAICYQQAADSTGVWVITWFQVQFAINKQQIQQVYE